MRIRALVAAVAGVVLSLAYEPVALPWVLPFCVAAFVLCTRGLRARHAWIPGLVFGVAFYFVHIWWMRAVGTAAWIALAGVESLFYALMGSISAVVQRHRLWPLWFAGAWTGVEVWRSGWPFSGMPWGRLAFAVIDTPAASALPYVGAVGVSLLLALLGATLAWVVVAGRRRHGQVLAVAGVVAVLAVFAAPALHPWSAPATSTLRVAVVQGDVPGNGDDILYDFRQVTQNHVDLTTDLARRVAAGDAARPDLVIWPENSTAVDPFSDAQTNAGILAATSAIGVPVLVGAIVDRGTTQVLNQGIVWDPETGAGDRYTKWHPVPYGEYIPFRRYMNGWNFGRLAEISRDMLSGTRTEPLQVRVAGAGTDIGTNTGTNTAGSDDLVPIADAICFDVAYDDGIQAQVSRGAQLLVVQTSNATFIHTDQIDQQFAITRERALETGRYVAVASTNGVTGIVAPDGHVVVQATPQTKSVLDQQVGLIDATTPATRLGPWPARVALLLGGLGLLFGLLAGRVPYRRRVVSRPAGDDSDGGQHDGQHDGHDGATAEPVGGRA